MANLRWKTATNKIVVQGRPNYTEMNVETATNMYPGRLVTVGTTDDDIVVCTASKNPIGFLGYEHTGEAWRPANIDTIYKASERPAVLRGGEKSVIRAHLAKNQTIAMGDPLVPGADGLLTAAVLITAAIASGSTPMTSANADEQPTIAGDIGARRVVAYAEESVTTTSATAPIYVRSEL